MGARAGTLRRLTAVVTGAVLLGAGLVTAPSASADRRDTVLTTGERLERGDVLVSPDGRIELQLAHDGGLRLMETGDWLTGNQPTELRLLGTDVAYVVLQADGNLVGYRADGSVAYDAFTRGSGATAVRVQDDRNVVYFDGSGRVVADDRSYLTSPLLTGRALRPGDSVAGPGSVRLVMQADGNLVLYRGGTALWSSRTGGNPGAGAVFQGDGNLVVYSSAVTGRRPLFASGSEVYADGAGYGELVVEDTEVSVVQRYTTQIAGYARWGSGWGSDRLLPGDELSEGDRRTSPDGRCELVADFVAVYLDCQDQVVWQGYVLDEHSADRTYTQWRMQGDGNFVGYHFVEGTGIVRDVLFSTGSSVPGSSLVVQDDRNVVVYGPDGRPSWSRFTGPLR